MNTFRKTLAVFAAASLLTGLAACGGAAETDVPAASSSVTDATETPTSAPAPAWPAQEKLKGLSADDITGVLFTRYTEGGAQSGVIEDGAEIEEVYLRLCNVRVAGPSDMGVEDDGLRLEIDASSDRLSFDFEGDILVLDDGSRFEVEQLDSLKNYLEGALEEATSAGDEDTDIEAGAAEADDISSSSSASLEDLRVFASPGMGFSFLYEPQHTAYIGENGTAMLAIDGDKARTGLFVSVVDDADLPSPDDYFEEEIFNLQQRYQNAMAVQPETDTLTVEGHELIGISYSYSVPTGGTVDCTEFIEQRDGKYVFYDTRAPRDTSGPELQALGVAMESLRMDADYYGPSDAVSGSLPADDYEAAGTTVSDGDPAKAAAASNTDFETGFTFDVDSSYLMISDETATQVYTGGTMDGAYFSVGKVTLTDNIGNTVVDRMNEVQDFLAERTVTPPDVALLEIGGRPIAGFTCAYSAVDGSKTICSEEYYEEMDGQTYCWYAVYDKGDTVTPAAMEHAMETFSVG